MTLEKIITPKIEIELFNEKWDCKFNLRNFAVLKQKYNISEDALLKGLIERDLLSVAYAIWASTIVFAPFDPTDPLKYEKTMELEELLKLSLADLQKAANQVVEAMAAYLPQPTAAEKAKAEKKRTAVKSTK